MGGDTVELRDGTLMLNGNRVYEPYVREFTFEHLLRDAIEEAKGEERAGGAAAAREVTATNPFARNPAHRWP